MREKRRGFLSRGKWFGLVNNTDLMAYCDTIKTMPIIWRNKGMGRERFRPSERRRVASRLRWFAAKESKAQILTLESNYPSHGKGTSYARMLIFTSTSDYLVRFQFQQSEIVRSIEKDDPCGFPFGAVGSFYAIYFTVSLVKLIINQLTKHTSCCVRKLHVTHKI